MEHRAQSGGLRARVLASFAALGIAGAAAGAEAQPAPDGRDREARALFEAGEVAYQDGRFEDALQYFRRSHELSGRPQLLYNIGLSADQARRDEEALEAYEAFLAAVPDTSLRTRVETRIAALRAILAEEPAPGPAEPPAPPPLPATAPDATPTPAPSLATDENRGGVGPGPWILVGAGGAALVVGAVLLGLVISDVNRVEGAQDGSDWADVEGAYERTLNEGRPIAAYTLLGVGVAAIAGGLLWWGLGRSRGAGGGAQARLELGPTSVRLRGVFR